MSVLKIANDPGLYVSLIFQFENRPQESRSENELPNSVVGKHSMPCSLYAAKRIGTKGFRNPHITLFLLQCLRFIVGLIQSSFLGCKNIAKRGAYSLYIPAPLQKLHKCKLHSFNVLTYRHFNVKWEDFDSPILFPINLNSATQLKLVFQSVQARGAIVSNPLQY